MVSRRALPQTNKQTTGCTVIRKQKVSSLETLRDLTDNDSGTRLFRALQTLVPHRSQHKVKYFHPKARSTNPIAWNYLFVLPHVDEPATTATVTIPILRQKMWAALFAGRPSRTLPRHQLK